MVLHRSALLLVVFAVLPVGCAAQSGEGAARAGEAHQEALPFDGLRRTYRVYVPPSYDGAEPAPLVLALHGGRGTGEKMERNTGFDPLADREGFIVVYPDGINHHWNDGRADRRHEDVRDVDDVGFISALIDHLIEGYEVDPKRVYVTGVSNGGILARRLGAELSEKIAAIAPVAAAIPVSGNTKEPLAPRSGEQEPVSVAMINGIEDRLVRWEGGYVLGERGGETLPAPETAGRWARTNACAPEPRVEYLPDRVPDDGIRTRRETYAGCAQGNEVVLYALEGGGHGWPASKLVRNSEHEIEATEVVWAFFEEHSKKSQARG